MPMTFPAAPPSAVMVELANLRERCIFGAAQHYQLRVDVLRAVLHKEGGTVGQVRWNTNGTFDMGPMQVNSSHLPKLARYGITAQNLTNNLCLNIYIGAWFLESCILKTGDLWRGIGCYHSPHNPALNAAYQWQVYAQLQRIWKRETP